MATFMATAPDGSKYRITAPDNATPDQLTAYAQKNIPAAPAKPAMDDENKPFNFDQSVKDLQQSAARQKGEGMQWPKLGAAIGNAASDAYHGVVDPIARTGEIAVNPSKMTKGDIPLMVAPFITGIPGKIAIPEAKAFANMGVDAAAVKAAKNPDLMSSILQSASGKTKQDIAAATGGKAMDDEALTQQTVQAISQKYENLKDAKNAAYEQAKTSGLATPVHDVSNIGVLKHIAGEIEDPPQGYTPGFANPRSDKTMPKEINTAKDLIDMRQSLNKKMTAETQKPITSPLVYDDLKEKLKQVNLALDEAKTKNPEFGKVLDAADAQHRLIKETYGGEVAKQLGLDENLFGAMRTAKTAGAKGDAQLSKAAFDNAVAATRGLIPAIETPEQINLLKNGMSREGFNDVMYKKVNDIATGVGEDGTKLRKARPLLDAMLKASGAKGDAVAQKLDTLQTVFDKYEAEEMRTKIPSAPYRGAKSGYFKNLVKATWGAVLALFGHATWGLQKGAEAAASAAAKGEGSSNAAKVMSLRNQLTSEPSIPIPGAAVGMYIGGSKGDNQ